MKVGSSSSAMMRARIGVIFLVEVVFFVI